MEGYPTFIISIVFIGMNTAVIGDVAGNLGCFIYLKDCVNAIAFVALGTSVPAIYSGYPTFVVAILFIGGNTAIIGDIAGHLGCFINLKDCVNAIAFVALGTSVPAIYNGYPTFVIAIIFIGGCTAIIGDIAGHLGCFINLKDCVNAIAFVALGTSVPDTFASKTAAIEDETADASIGNVTGSNAVNVFLGIGIAWTMAAVYWEAQGMIFKVPVGSLGFSVTIFCIEALLAIAILMIRRSPALGGAELGGPKIFKTISAAIFVFFWVFYVAISALEAYGVINPGF